MRNSLQTATFCSTNGHLSRRKPPSYDKQTISFHAAKHTSHPTKPTWLYPIGSIQPTRTSTTTLQSILFHQIQRTKSKCHFGTNKASSVTYWHTRHDAIPSKNASPRQAYLNLRIKAIIMFLWKIRYNNRNKLEMSYLWTFLKEKGNDLATVKISVICNVILPYNYV